MINDLGLDDAHLWTYGSHATGGEKSTSFSGPLKQLGAIWLHPDLVCDESTLVDKINKTFFRVMEDYFPLTECVCVDMDDD